MVGVRIPQQNFSKGILSKELWGRSDIAPYSAGVRQAENVHILKYGGLSKRPGSRLVYEVKDGPKRMMPFEGAFEASYAIIMGQASMRLAALGGMVVEQALTIEDATNTNPVAITAAFHGFTTGDEVFFNGVLGMEELNGRILPVTVTGENTFTVPVDGTEWGEFIGDEGGVTRTEEPSPAPPPPPVPPPAPTPTPPPTGGGGGGGGGWRPGGGELEQQL